MISEGSKVRYIGKKHETSQKCYPLPGTIGKVIHVIDNWIEAIYFVEWPNGSTSGTDRWFADESELEEVTEKDKKSAACRTADPASGKTKK